MITDAIGSSETGFTGISFVSAGGPHRGGPTVTPGPSTIVIDDDGRRVVRARSGRLARGGHMPLGYYKDPVKTAAMFVEVDGERYVVPGDMARVEEDGTITLLGRGNMCVNTGGEKVFPEEVEGAIKEHPDVFDTLVIGMPDERLGQRVAAIVQPRQGASLDLADLEEDVRGHLAGYKVPRTIWLTDQIGRHGERQGRLRLGARVRRQPSARPRPSARTTGGAVNGAVSGTCGPPLCDRLGIEYPIVGFTPSEHVAAAISRAGGLGVLGCVRFNDAAELEAALAWMDAEHRRPPVRRRRRHARPGPGRGRGRRPGPADPAGHREFVEQTLLRLGVPPLPADAEAGGRTRLAALGRARARRGRAGASRRADRQRARLAAGRRDRRRARARHAVAALAGKAEHAARHVARGVDIVVAQGYEAGGHTGEIATMVLVPEVVDAVGAGVPVLAAGGIGSGRQIVAALALGAAGVWMGSYWLTTQEYQQLATAPAVRDALLAATSSDTVRSRIYSGKPARLLKNEWTSAWEEPGAPEPLPHAAAEPAGQRGAPAADGVRAPGRGADAGRPDRRPDERGPAGRRGDGRTGRRKPPRPGPAAAPPPVTPAAMMVR